MTMFKPSHLVPILNEMMEEYAEREKEAIQPTHVETVQEEERAEARAKIEQLVEETRKRRRGVKESSYLISEHAYFAWRNKLQHRDFIGKRGFSNLISPFQEIVESKG